MSKLKGRKVLLPAFFLVIKSNNPLKDPYLISTPE